MNEVIGAKGGSNDRRRSLVISKNLLKKLKQHRLKRLEKKVRIIQVGTFFKTTAILIPYSFLNILFKRNKNKEIIIINKKEKNNENKKINNKKQ